MASPTDYQKALFGIWASGTGFELDLEKSVKAEFARLALIRGWKGGDRNWNMHWFMCFGSDYGYGPHFAPRVVPVVNDSSNTPVEEDAVGLEQWEFLSRSSESDASGIRIYTPSTVSWEEVEHDDIDGMAAFEAHLGDNPHDVGGWQKLCTIIGIELIPDSITKCKKAIKSKPVNIVNLLKHLNNPQVPLIHFQSYQAFRNYTNKKMNKFPRVKAKTNRFLRELLKHL